MLWLKKHADTVSVLSGILGSFLWMNSQINQLKNDMAELKTDIAVMKTVLVIKKVMPSEIDGSHSKEEKK